MAGTISALNAKSPLTVGQRALPSGLLYVVAHFTHDSCFKPPALQCETIIRKGSTRINRGALRTLKFVTVGELALISDQAALSTIPGEGPNSQDLLDFVQQFNFFRIVVFF
jgi:hypothetical protein